MAVEAAAATAPARTTVALANVSGAATVRVTLGAALVRDDHRRATGVFHPRNPPSSRTACRTPSRADVRVRRRARRGANRLVEGGVPRDGFGTRRRRGNRRHARRDGSRRRDVRVEVRGERDGRVESHSAAGQIVGFTASSVVVVARGDWRQRIASTYRPGPYVAGVSGEFKVTFMDARGNNRYASGTWTGNADAHRDGQAARSDGGAAWRTIRGRPGPGPAFRRGVHVVRGGALSIAFVDTSGNRW